MSVMRLSLAVLATSAMAEESGRHYARGYKRMPVPANDVANLGIANITAEDLKATPSSIDWSTKGALTPINDQNNCGSCWAESTTETVESAVFMSTGKLPGSLSVQQLVSCDKLDGGCNGGDPQSAVRYLKGAGFGTAVDYPDTSSKSGKTGKCKWDRKAVVAVSGFTFAVPDAPPAACQKCFLTNCPNLHKTASAACQNCVQKQQWSCASSCRPYPFSQITSWFCGSEIQLV